MSGSYMKYNTGLKRVKSLKRCTQTLSSIQAITALSAIKNKESITLTQHLSNDRSCIWDTVKFYLVSFQNALFRFPMLWFLCLQMRTITLFGNKCSQAGLYYVETWWQLTKTWKKRKRKKSKSVVIEKVLLLVGEGGGNHMKK